jgi:hypothetical protein
MSAAIPVTLTFASVMTEIASFLANPLVIAALTGMMALHFAPKIWWALEDLALTRDGWFDGEPEHYDENYGRDPNAPGGPG